MTSTRSVYSWDLIIHRVDDKIFIDKPDNSVLDMWSVDETASDPPVADGDAINAPLPLAAEATVVNQAFAQKCLQQGGARHVFEKPDPFVQPGENAAPVAYRYRKWQLDDELSVIARCAACAPRAH